MSKTIELSEAETVVWEDSGPDGERSRRAHRAIAATMGGHVEIVSFDGIVLDAIDSPRSAAWTFEGYWNTVLGAYVRAADIVREWELAGEREDIDAWLKHEEQDAWAKGADSSATPDEWRPFHERALDQLCEAVEEAKAEREAQL